MSDLGALLTEHIGKGHVHGALMKCVDKTGKSCIKLLNLIYSFASNELS
jgi:hypothetical protein